MASDVAMRWSSKTIFGGDVTPLNPLASGEGELCLYRSGSTLDEHTHEISPSHAPLGCQLDDHLINLAPSFRLHLGICGFQPSIMPASNSIGEQTMIGQWSLGEISVSC